MKLNLNFETEKMFGRTVAQNFAVLVVKMETGAWKKLEKMGLRGENFDMSRC